MTKNIVVIGCSFSTGHYDAPKDNKFLSNWPRILSQKILDNGLDYNVYNLSQYCSSPILQTLQLRTLLKHDPDFADFIVIQFTTPTRKTYFKKGHSEYHKILENHSVHSKNMTNSQNNHTFNSNYYELYPAGMSVENKKIQTNLNSVINLNPGMATSFRNDDMADDKILDLYENTIMYDIEMHDIISYTAYLHYAASLLDKFSIPYLLYLHNSYWTEDEWIKPYDFALSELWKEDFDSYVVDNGTHFGYTGNTRLVNELIWPRICKDLNV